jgi:hypothetical protein
MEMEQLVLVIASIAAIIVVIYLIMIAYGGIEFPKF